VSDDATEAVRLKFDTKFWLGCFAVIAAFMTWQILTPKKAVLKNVPAPPFILPEGCNPADVRLQFDFKSKSPCFDDKYLIRDYERYNFSPSSGSRFLERKYYRFYDRAVHTICASNEACHVSEIYNHVFLESDKVNN
jgi:hypothetical protein